MVLRCKVALYFATFEGYPKSIRACAPGQADLSSNHRGENVSRSQYCTTLQKHNLKENCEN